MSVRVSLVNTLAWTSIALILTGCAQWGSRETTRWPDDIPPEAEFEAIYEQDTVNRSIQTRDEYLAWVRRFYHGWKFYGQGWNDFAPEVLAEVDDPQERAYLEQLIGELGQDIAGEWAKDAELSRITSRHLSIWGNALREAMVQGEERQILEQIARDVEHLLDQHLMSQDITASRYYAEDENDVFR